MLETPAVVALSFASFPLTCGKSEADSLCVLQGNGTCGKNPDNSAAILPGPPAPYSYPLGCANTPQFVSVKLKEQGAREVILKLVNLPNGMITGNKNTRSDHSCQEFKQRI